MPPPLPRDSVSPTAWCANTWFGRCSTAVNTWISTAMTDSSTSFPTDIERDPVHLAAADWFVRLQSTDVSIEDTLAWQSWMNDSPANARAFARIEEVSDALRAVAAPSVVSAREFASDRYDGSVPIKDWKAIPQSRRPWRAIALAASFAFVALAISFWQ